MIEFIPSIFSDHNGLKLEINSRESWKVHKYLEIKQHTLEHQRTKEEIKKEIRKYLETNENKNTNTGTSLLAQVKNLPATETCILPYVK